MRDDLALRPLSQHRSMALRSKKEVTDVLEQRSGHTGRHTGSQSVSITLSALDLTEQDSGRTNERVYDR